MFWCSVILSLTICVIQITEIRAANVKKEIKFSCVSKDSDSSFRVFELHYDWKIDTKNKIARVKDLIANRERIILHFLHFEQTVEQPIHFAGHTFRAQTYFDTAKVQMNNTEACVCFVSYQYLQGIGGPWVVDRGLKVAKMAAAFLQNLINLDEFKIKLSSVYLSGFAIGGHIAGLTGRALRKINKKGVPVVWAFDPHVWNFIDSEKKNYVAKGDAELVVVFHTSQLPAQWNLADVDIIVNDAKAQPGCGNPKLSAQANQEAAAILHQLIVKKSQKLPLNSKKVPIARSGSKKFPLDMTGPPPVERGVFYMKTGDIFGSSL